VYFYNLFYVNQGGIQEAMKASNMTKRDFLKCLAAGAGCALAGSAAAVQAGRSKDRRPSSLLPQGRQDAKGSVEAYHYTMTPRGPKCLICPNNCVVKPDEESICHTRINMGGKLYTIAYGNPCAVHIDPVEKKPLYHFLPGTRTYSVAEAGCNLACLNCQNWEISQTSPRKTVNQDLMPSALVKKCLENTCQSIAYTYSEPLAWYEYTYDSARAAREKGIRNILVSAGYINEKPLRELAPYIDAANIDLKSFSNDIYQMLNSGTLEPVLNTLRVLKEEGVWLEITNLVVPSWTDDMDMIKRMCEWLCNNNLAENPLHFSRFHPIYKLSSLSQTPQSVLVKARETALRAGLKYVYIGNVPGTDAENTYCPVCKKPIVVRKGFVVVSNDIREHKCSFCSATIAGVWK